MPIILVKMGILMGLMPLSNQQPIMIIYIQTGQGAQGKSLIYSILVYEYIIPQKFRICFKERRRGEV